MITYSKKMREIINEQGEDLEQGKDRVYIELDNKSYKIEMEKGENKKEYTIYMKNKDKYGAFLMKIKEHNRNFKVIEVEKLKMLWEYVEEKTGTFDEDIEYITLQEALDKYSVLKECKKFDDDTFVEFMTDNNLNPSELECTFNWGITEDGRLVCLDYADCE